MKIAEKFTQGKQQWQRENGQKLFRAPQAKVPVFWHRERARKAQSISRAALFHRTSPSRTTHQVTTPWGHSTCCDFERTVFSVLFPFS